MKRINAMPMPHPKFCRYLIGFAVVTLLLLLPRLRAQPNAPEAILHPATKIVFLHEVVIGQGGGRDLHAEIAYPRVPTGPLPAVIYIHGGGWIGGDYHDTPIEVLARAGFFAASIEYRLSDEAKWPAQIEDCKLGVRWLRAHAATYNIDPNRIGAWGASAGGHLVACLGTMADQKQYEGNGGYPGVSSAVQAVVDFYGPTDLTRPDIYSPFAIKVSTALFGCAFQDNPAIWKSGSPLYFVKAGDPPVLIVQGDSDSIVPMAQSTIFDDALTKAGVPHQLIIVKNADHGFAPVGGKPIDPNPAQIRDATLAFLAKYLKTP